MGTNIPPTLEPPREVMAIARALEEAGFETWCVGGAVRDALLGLPHLDWDLATAATPEQVKRIFPRRTIPKGIQFGTVGVLDPNGGMHEVTTFRRDIETDGRHAVVQFGASLDEDLARRDFTINAIAYSPTRRVLRDPFGGRADLARRVVRAVGEPFDRMREDWLRALRAMRFAARFEFTIEGATWDAVCRSAPQLPRLSRERVKEEFEKVLVQSARPSVGLELWRSSGALETLVPPLAAQPAVAFRAVDCLPVPSGPRRDQRVMSRLAAPFVTLRAEEVRRVLRGLRFANTQVAWIAHLAEAWGTVGDTLERALERVGSVSDATLRAWTAAVGRTYVAPLVRIAAALWAARRASGMPAPRAPVVRSLYRHAVRTAYRDPIELADLAADGEDLRRLGVAPGPAMGKILRALLEAVIADPTLNSRDRLIELALIELARQQLDQEGGSHTPHPEH